MVVLLTISTTHEPATDLGYLLHKNPARVQSFANVAEEWENDGPGKQIQFPGTVLTRTENSVGQNPYLIIRVDPALIPSHDDITDQRVIEFVTQMILVSSQTHDYSVRKERRQRVKGQGTSTG